MSHALQLEFEDDEPAVPENLIYSARTTIALRLVRLGRIEPADALALTVWPPERLEAAMDSMSRDQLRQLARSR